GVAAGNWKSKRDRIGAEHAVNAALGVDPDGVSVGNDKTDEAGTRNALGIKPEHENIAATDEADCADACILRLAHCELGSENADDVTGSSIAVDAGGRRGFLRDTRLRAAIEAARAQFPDRREDMIDPLDVMAGKVRGEHPVRIHLRILPIASSRHENACEKFAQHLRLDANLLGTHGFKTKPATPPASTRTASLKSSMRIASC